MNCCIRFEIESASKRRLKQTYFQHTYQPPVLIFWCHKIYIKRRSLPKTGPKRGRGKRWKHTARRRSPEFGRLRRLIPYPETTCPIPSAKAGASIPYPKACSFYPPPKPLPGYPTPKPLPGRGHPLPKPLPRHPTYKASRKPPKPGSRELLPN